MNPLTKVLQHCSMYKLKYCEKSTHNAQDHIVTAIAVNKGKLANQGSLQSNWPIS